MTAQSASEEGWHASRYNVAARIPGDAQGRVAVANLYGGTFGAYPPLELAALAMLDELPATHPAVERLIRRGLVVNFDERAAIESLARSACAGGRRVNLTICPTMGCNFDCPYCFESHRPGKMPPEIQDDVVALAGRMLKTSGATRLTVTWFGGEPLLAPNIIETLTMRLVALAKKHGASYEAVAITNGYLLTPKIADTLARCRVTKLQVTIDGMGAAHNATRHLAGGGPTFERIVENLARPGLPFRVDVRHNVHDGNRTEIDRLRDFVERIADESGNDLAYYPALVVDTQTAERRGRQVGIVGGCDATDVLLSGKLGVSGVHPIHCGAGTIWDVGVDPMGRLHKCWEAIDKSELSFGNAHDWDPADPLRSAERPDLLTCFLNSSSPHDDKECRDCLWLPLCAGGCPYERLFNGARKCLPYKDDPKRYALALWRTRANLDGKTPKTDSRGASRVCD